MSMSLLFCHGWGFDATAWSQLASLLPEFEQVRDDAGYFGAPESPGPGTPYIAVTHSLGTLRLLASPPPGLAGLVAIAGFDRFTETDGFPGVPRRVVDRMVSAVGQAPETVLADFHAQIGSAPPAGTPDAARLQAGLVALRDDDRRGEAAELGLPILSLQGARDPLLSVALRETVFASARQVMRRTHPDAGHLLLREDPAWCAGAIRAFIDGLP